DVIGLNCATGPNEMTEHLRHLSQHARTFLSALPNAGLPSVVDGRTHYDLTPDELAEAHDRFTSEFGVNVVGGCCGTTPEHLRRVVETIGNRAPLERHPEHEPGCASIYSHVPFHQETSFLVVGERTNTNGSKKFRESMLEEEWETCVQMAREQVKEGSHVLDVCVDYVGRDGTADMDEIASRFATQASIPLVFDSPEPQVMEVGLQHFGGKAILNSANLEDGDGEGARLDRVLKLAREYGAAVVCMTIDEEGQARTTDWKFRIAKRIYHLAQERYGLDPTDLIFDCLTFPLSTGQDDLRRDGVETMEAIKRVKAELPGASTILGVSNVSFGLKPAARHVLNSVFLHECVEAGLDAAIVHAARIMPMHKIDDRIQDVALDLVYDRRRDGYDPLTEFMALFEGVEASAVEQEDRPGWPVEERLKHRILDGDRDGHDADAIGMSGLLVKSTIIMRENLEELNDRGLDRIPVLLGGAALTRNYVERDLREVYKGRVFYGKDAFEGLRTMDTLVEGKRSGQLDPDFGRALEGRALPPRKSQRAAEEPTDVPARSDVATDVPVFEPPFLGARVAKGISIDDIASYLNETALFRNQWQFRPEKRDSEPSETDAEFKDRIRAVLRDQLDRAKAEGLLVPAVAWGYFPVNADGDDLVVWSDDDRTTERLRFGFPRQQ